MRPVSACARRMECSRNCIRSGTPALQSGMPNMHTEEGFYIQENTSGSGSTEARVRRRKADKGWNDHVSTVGRPRKIIQTRASRNATNSRRKRRKKRRRKESTRSNKSQKKLTIPRGASRKVAGKAERRARNRKEERRARSRRTGHRGRAQKEERRLASGRTSPMRRKPRSRRFSSRDRVQSRP